MSDTLPHPAQSGLVQLAQAAEPVGHVENAEGAASLVRVDGSHAAAAVGAPVYEGDTAQTGPGGLIGIVFSDNSVFALGENGKMVVDDLVFDPAAQTGVSAFSIHQGVFSFISGQIAKAAPDATVIHTPVASIGIRGTSLAGKAAPSGETNVITLVPDPDGRVGEATLSNNGGVQVLNTAYQTTQLSSAFLPPSVPIVLPKSVIDRVFSQVTRAVERMAPAPSQEGGEADAPSGDATQGAPEGGAEAPGLVAEGAAGREGEAPLTEGEQAVAQAFEQALAEGGSLESAFAAAVGEATKVAALAGAVPTVGPAGEVGFGGLAGIGGLIAGLFSGGADAFAGAAAGGDNGVFGPPQGPGNLLGGPESLLGQGDNPFGLGDFLGAIEQGAENLEQQIVHQVDTQIQNLYTTAAPRYEHYVANSSTVTLLSGYQDVVIGTMGNDTVTINGQAIAGEADSYTGQGGTDSVSLNYAGSNTFGFTNSAGASSTLDLSNTGTGVQSIAFYAEGTLTFTLPASGSQGYYQIAGTTTDGSAANQSFIFNQVLANATGSSSNKINGSTGTDSVTLASGTNYLTVLGVEQVNHASSGTNATVFEFAMSGVSIAGGSGTDTVTLSNANVVSVSGVETLTGGAGSDAVTLTAATTSMTLDTAAGTDSVTLANGTNTLTISNAEAVTGGTGADTITFGAAISSGTVDLAGGTDTLTLAAGGNTLSISNVETVTGGGGNDTVTFGAAITSASFDGDAGTDVLSLANGTNSVTVSNAETIVGGTGADSLTFGTAASSAVVTLGGGSDSVVLGNFANSLTITGVETVTGGSNNDAVTVGDSTAVTFSGGAGADTVTGGSGADYLDGGIGSDVLYGQTGNDVFVYTTREVASIDTSDFTNSSQDDVFQFTSSVYGGTASVTAVSLANGGAVGGDANNLLFLTSTVTDQNTSSTVDHTDVLTIVNGLDFSAGAGGKNVSRFVVFQDADDNGIYVGHLAASGSAATNYSDLDIVAKTAATAVSDLTAADFTFA